MAFYRAYDQAQLFDKLKQCAVDNYTHDYYQRTIDVAKWCHRMTSGNDQKEILVRFRSMESKKQQDQRFAVYNTRTPQVANKVISLFNEVHRSDDITDDKKYDGKDAKQSNEMVAMLNDKLSDFDGNKSLREWQTDKMKKYNFTDPNAWAIVEFEGKLPERMVYPFEATSDMVVDFSIQFGITQYICVKIPQLFRRKSDRSKYKQFKFTLYAYDYNHDLIPVPDNTADLIDWQEPLGYERITLTGHDGTSKEFYYAALETKNEQCPAFRFGYIDDLETNGMTKVSPLHLAEHVFERLIQRTSTHDISHALHGFYKMLMYAERCNHRIRVGTETQYCENGYIGGVVCEQCKGTGKRMHLSDQDVVMYLLDEGGNAANNQPLSNYIHYATIDTELIQEQKREIEEAASDALSTIFNENIFDKSILADTATAIHYNWRSVDNRLMDYGDHDAQMHMFFVYSIADLYGMAKNLKFIYAYPSDFKLETVPELFEYRSSAVSSNSPTQTIRSLDIKILSKLHRDDPDYIEEFKVREKFKPLRNKSESERLSWISGLPELHPIKILDLYYDEIFDNIMVLFPQFVEYPYKQQRAIVDAQLALKISEEKQLRDSLMPAPLFNAQNEDSAQDEVDPDPEEEEEDSNNA